MKFLILSIALNISLNIYALAPQSHIEDATIILNLDPELEPINKLFQLAIIEESYFNYKDAIQTLYLALQYLSEIRSRPSNESFIATLNSIENLINKYIYKISLKLKPFFYISNPPLVVPWGKTYIFNFGDKLYFKGLKSIADLSLDDYIQILKSAHPDSKAYKVGFKIAQLYGEVKNYGPSLLSIDYSKPSPLYDRYLDQNEIIKIGFQMLQDLIVFSDSNLEQTLPDERSYTYRDVVANIDLSNVFMRNMGDDRDLFSSVRNKWVLFNALQWETETKQEVKEIFILRKILDIFLQLHPEVKIDRLLLVGSFGWGDVDYKFSDEDFDIIIFGNLSQTHLQTIKKLWKKEALNRSLELKIVPTDHSFKEKINLFIEQLRRNSIDFFKARYDLFHKDREEFLAIEIAKVLIDATYVELIGSSRNLLLENEKSQVNSHSFQLNIAA